MRRALALSLLATALAGCQAKVPESAKVPLGQVPAAAPAQTVEIGAPLIGQVLETLDASTYTYVRIKTSKGEVWAAVPAAKIAKGTTVTVNSPMLMEKFQSPTLKRTFDQIYFGTLASPGAGAATPASAPSVGAPPPSASILVAKVARASGAYALTISDTWAQKASLAGKTVSIRGTVVKYNAGVMGKNWIHLQDGSGDAKLGTHDITVTSLDGAMMGETITIKGTVRTNQDFGAGYSYAVMVDDAKVVKK